jgi:colicin import membrane protein
MKLPQMRAGLVVSTVLHTALLLWGIVSFSSRPLAIPQADALPVDIITPTEFAQLNKGAKNAPKAEIPAPAADKVAEKKPAEEIAPKIEEKPEVKSPAVEPPPPAPKPVEAKREPKKPQPKTDPIAEALKKEEARKLAEAKAKPAPPKPAPPQPRFDPNRIAALLDKREPSRNPASEEMIAPAPPSLGMPTGSAPKLSQSELDAMRAKLMQLWNPPAGAANPEQMIVRIRIQLSRDGRLVGPPMVLTSGRGSVFETARDNAIRALFMGQPFSMLSPATYDLWKEIEITFDPRDMYRG